MKQLIDCLIIGHNEMDFRKYEETIRKMGMNSGAYRDLGKNFIYYNHKPYHFSEIFNLLKYNEENSIDSPKPLTMGETFSPVIAYLGTYLYRRGFTFDYVNSFQEKKEELSKKLVQENILTIAITTTLYISVFPVLEIINFIKKHNHSAKIIIGGPFISTQVKNLEPEAIDYLFHSIDADFYVNSSQGEATLVKIIDSLKNNLPFERINNIYYKRSNGNGYEAAPIMKEDNKLSENIVDWNLFSDSVEEYAAVRTSISCPFSCAFCGFPQHAGKYQTVPVELIEKELNQLDKIEPLKSVHFIDDTFNIPVYRFKEILKMMVKNKYRFRWHSYFRCQFVDREIAELMKESGCDGVFLGIESGSNQILKNMNKAADVGKYLDGIALLKEKDIVTYGNFIIGFPGETYETVRETAEFIEKSGLDFYRAQLWYFEPITPIWKQRDRYKIEGESFEWSHSTMNFENACDLIDEIFLTTDKSLWVPQYNFDFDTLCHLFHRGMTVEQIRNSLEGFNNGVQEKLRTPSQKNISYEAIMRLKNSLTDNNYSSDFLVGEEDVIDHSEAEFDFESIK